MLFANSAIFLVVKRVFSSLMSGRVLKMAELLPLKVNIKAVKSECVLFAILHVTCQHIMLINLAGSSREGPQNVLSGLRN